MLCRVVWQKLTDVSEVFTTSSLGYYRATDYLIRAPDRDILVAFWSESLWSDRPDDRGSKYLRNVGQFLPEYMAQRSRRHLHAGCRENLKSHVWDNIRISELRE
jgi:hypothetical protein